MKFKAEIEAIITLIWIIIRYIFVCLFWPLLRVEKGQNDLKVYFNGDIITPKVNKGQQYEQKIESIVTKGQTIVFVGSLVQAQEYVRDQKHQMIDLKGQYVQIFKL